MEVVAHHGPLYCPSLPFLNIPKAPPWPSNTPLQPSSCSPLPQIRSLLHFLRSLSAPFSLRSMASLTGSAVFTSACPCPCASRQSQVVKGFSGLKTVSFNNQRRNFPSLRSQRFRVSCAAKVETVQKVCEIVRKQLALADDTPVTGESKFSDFGADSLDTVEIVMGLEEAFEITVEEDNAQSIATVQDAADLIEKLVEAK